jgi:hypothetical protein
VSGGRGWIGRKGIEEMDERGREGLKQMVGADGGEGEGGEGEGGEGEGGEGEGGVGGDGREGEGIRLRCSPLSFHFPPRLIRGHLHNCIVTGGGEREIGLRLIL